ncbi:hypothetical protein BVX99_00410 [bacterium F16]|nr:hypothetical protein BVX99_00410 [bacterium F16]
MGGNPKLIILSEQLRGQTFELTGERYGIGRSEEMEICIVDQTVSGRHCELVRNDEGGYTAVDEGYSTNGTRINGMLVTRQAMVNSDILQVGGIECMYDCDSDAPSSVISTQTQIRIDDETIDANTRTNLAPAQLQGGENPMVKVFFRIFIGILVLTVIGLAVWLGLMLLSSPPAQ